METRSWGQTGTKSNGSEAWASMITSHANIIGCVNT